MTVITAALCQKKVRGSPRGVRVDGGEETGVLQSGGATVTFAQWGPTIAPS